MDSRVIGGIGSGAQLPASFALPTIPGKTTEFKAPVPAPQVQQQAPEVTVPTANTGVDPRLELIQRISVEKFSYPLGDSRFTIFKDAKSGQYIVRYTSLKDGSIKQIPEPELLADFVARGKGPIVSTSA